MLLRTLGGLALEGTGFHRPKPLLLLAYLALEGPKLRRYLAEVFFMDAKDPLNSLSRSLSYLRRDVPGSFGADEKRVWTSLDCDAVSLLGLVEAGKVEGCPELYLGPFAEEIDFPLGIELEEWVYGTREFLAGRMREALLVLGERAATEGKFQATARYAEEAYSLSGVPEPEPEDFTRLYALLQAGHSPHAAELRKEAEIYGLALTTNSEKSRVQRSEGRDIPHVIPYTLPISRTSFVGRDLERLELGRHLSDPQCRILTLTGFGGVGKTRLGLQIAHDQLHQKHFQDGIHFVPLEVLDNPTDIPFHIAERLDLTLRAGVEPVVDLAHHLGEKRILLLLDNFEHLLEGAPFLPQLIEFCPSLKLLITSRGPLNLFEEHIFPLDGLALSDESYGDLAVAEAQEAIQLFVQRAKSSHLRFTLAPDLLSSVLQICRLLHGNPLGIELAAAWVRVLPPVEILAELQRNLDSLINMDRTANERHQSLHAVFEHSWRLLTPKEQMALSDLSVFRGGFRREASSEIADATLATLAKLTDRSLLQFSVDGRYFLHPLVQTFSAQRLSITERQTSTRDRHARYYLDLLVGMIDPNPAIHNARPGELQPELGNLRTAWERAVSEQWTDLLHRTAHPLERLCDLSANYRLGLDLLKRAETMLAQAGSKQIEAHLKASRAWLLMRLGRYNASASLAREALPVLKRAQDRQGMRTALNSLGAALDSSGRFEEATSFFQEVLELEKSGSVYAATAQANLGLNAQNLGDFESAEAHFRQALEGFQRQGQKRAEEVRTAFILSELLLERGKIGEATVGTQNALALAEKLKIEHWRILLLLLLGRIQSVTGDLEKAAENCDLALNVAAAAGVPEIQADARCLQGEIAAHKGDLAEADRFFRRALELATQLGYRPRIFRVLRRLLGAWLTLGDKKRAALLAGFLSKAVDDPLLFSFDREGIKTMLEENRDVLHEAKQAWDDGQRATIEELLAACHL